MADPTMAALTEACRFYRAKIAGLEADLSKVTGCLDLVAESRRRWTCLFDRVDRALGLDSRWDASGPDAILDAIRKLKAAEKTPGTPGEPMGCVCGADEVWPPAPPVDLAETLQCGCGRRYLFNPGARFWYQTTPAARTKPVEPKVEPGVPGEPRTCPCGGKFAEDWDKWPEGAAGETLRCGCGRWSRYEADPNWWVPTTAAELGRDDEDDEPTERPGAFAMKPSAGGPKCRLELIRDGGLNPKKAGCEVHGGFGGTACPPLPAEEPGQ